MTNPVIDTCPVCAESLTITRLKCSHCETEISGAFHTSAFSQLPPEDLAFAEMFIRLRGNVKEMERELGIPYSAVRNRLDSVIRNISNGEEDTPPPPNPSRPNRRSVLDRLERGEISPDDAVRLLGGAENESEDRRE